MSKDVSRTVHAQQAMEITDLFSYKFGALRFGQTTPRRLKLQEPDGPSTAGGLQARQALVLQADEDPQTMMLGWVDSAQRRAEVKSLKALQAQYKQRNQRDLDLEPDEFDRLFDELRGFLKIQKIELTEVEPAPPAVSTPRAPVVEVDESSSNVGAIAFTFVAGMTVGLLIGYLVFGA